MGNPSITLLVLQFFQTKIHFISFLVPYTIIVQDWITSYLDSTAFGSRKWLEDNNFRDGGRRSRKIYLQLLSSVGLFLATEYKRSQFYIILGGGGSLLLFTKIATILKIKINP